MMISSVRLYLASAAGLMLSGFLTDRLSWRLICVRNILLAIVAVRLLRSNFPELPEAASLRLGNADYPGLTLVAIGFLSLQVVLSRGHIDEWLGSPRIRLLTVVSTAAFMAFVLWELSAKDRYPLLDMSLLGTATRWRRCSSASLRG